MLGLPHLIGGSFEAVGAGEVEFGDPLGGGFAGVGDDIADLAVGKVVARGEFFCGDRPIGGFLGGGSGPRLEDFAVAR